MADPTGHLSELRKLLATGGLPDLGPGPRPAALPASQLKQRLDKLLPLGGSATSRELVHALLLLWHDHLDAAHTISQAMENADGSFLHGIVHRREPDYGNAKYWFRRVGEHGAFPRIAACVAPLLEARDAAALREKLLPGGAWDPFAFVDVCESAARKPGSDPLVQLLREIQGIESEVLLDYFCVRFTSV